MANNGMPSMLALLGLLAVAGYQNRDKIAGALNDLKARSPQGADGNPDVLGGLAGTLGGIFGGGAAGQAAGSGGGLGDLLKNFGLGGDDGAGRQTGLAGGLEGLLDSFRQSGDAKVADSWITPGVETEGLRPDQVERAIGAENLSELSHRTGLSRDELIERLAKTIPDAVDAMTPGGHMPTDDEFKRGLWPNP